MFWKYHPKLTTIADCKYTSLCKGFPNFFACRCKGRRASEAVISEFIPQNFSGKSQQVRKTKAQRTGICMKAENEEGRYPEILFRTMPRGKPSFF